MLRFVLADEVALDSAADADDLSLWWWDSSEWLDDEALERRILGGRGALAGEFVSAAYGTTSGAWDSGVRAAECVIGLGGCAESDSAAGVPPADRLLVVLALAVAVLA